MKKFICEKKEFLIKVLVILLIVSNVWIVFTSLDGSSIRNSSTGVSLDQSWNISVNGMEQPEKVELPYRFHRNDKDTYEFTTLLPESAFQSQVLQITVYFKDVWIYIDNELVYENVANETILGEKNAGTGNIHLVLPSNSEGKELKIVYACLPCSESTYFNVPIILDGAKDVFAFSISDVAMLFLMIAFIFIAVLLVVIYFSKIATNFPKKSVLYLALFFISFAVWALCYTRIMELWIDNWGLTLNLEYMAFYATPMAAWLLYSSVWKLQSDLANAMKAISIGYYSMTILSKAIFNVSFTFFLSSFHVFALITILILGIDIFRNFKNKETTFHFFAFGIGFLILSSVIALIRFYGFPGQNILGLAFVLSLATAGIFLIMSVLELALEAVKTHYRKTIAQNQKIEYERYESLICKTGDVFFDWSMDTDTAYISSNFQEFFSCDIDENEFSKTIYNLIPELQVEDRLEHTISLLQGDSNYEKIDCSFRDQQGERRYISIDLSMSYDDNGEKTHIIGIIKDTTSSVKLEAEYSRQMQFIDINHQMYDNILEADIERNCIVGNQSTILAKSLGLDGDATFGEIIENIAQQLTHPDYTEAYREFFSRERILSLYKDGIDHFELETYELSDKGVYEWLYIKVVVYKSNQRNSICLISYVQNITKKKVREMALLESASRDSLSQLLNKGASREAINHILISSDPKETCHALLLMDIDEFKMVNDKLGHAMGDKVILDVSQKLKGKFREEDLLGRFGGDEFVVLIRNIKNEECVKTKCEELNRELHISYGNDGKEQKISLSIGVAFYPRNGEDYDTLCNHADLAMYESKNKGRNTYTIYRE